tara:strand:+ start:1399 stop:1524 length:126 start_codon:yes stop_codon:yes gene_type:complete
MGFQPPDPEFPLVRGTFRQEQIQQKDTPVEENYENGENGTK